MWLPLTVATSPPVPVALMQPPLSAFARLTRPLQQRTAKENKDAATCSPQIPQGAKAVTPASQHEVPRLRSVISV